MHGLDSFGAFLAPSPSTQKTLTQNANCYFQTICFVFQLQLLWVFLGWFRNQSGAIPFTPVFTVAVTTGFVLSSSYCWGRSAVIIIGFVWALQQLFLWSPPHCSIGVFGPSLSCRNLLSSTSLASNHHPLCTYSNYTTSPFYNLFYPYSSVLILFPLHNLFHPHPIFTPQPLPSILNLYSTISSILTLSLLNLLFHPYQISTPQLLPSLSNLHFTTSSFLTLLPLHNIFHPYSVYPPQPLTSSPCFHNLVHVHPDPM